MANSISSFHIHSLQKQDDKPLSFYGILLHIPSLLCTLKSNYILEYSHSSAYNNPLFQLAAPLELLLKFAGQHLYLFVCFDNLLWLDIDACFIHLPAFLVGLSPSDIFSSPVLFPSLGLLILFISSCYLKK